MYYNYTKLEYYRSKGFQSILKWAFARFMFIKFKIQIQFIPSHEQTEKLNTIISSYKYKKIENENKYDSLELHTYIKHIFYACHLTTPIGVET